MFSNSGYNPDVLSCLANLSSDEVFTPPQLANKILDNLPNELWHDKNAKFLDPACKSGVFLREIAKRLMIGLEKEIPDIQVRLNHIFQNQLYGIAITELTALLSRRSLYCSKNANGKYSVCDIFDTAEGNIHFVPIQHEWENGTCRFCGASQSQYDRGEGLESYAYQFIHTDTPEELFSMKFDVIIGNPPYQLNDGGFGRSASPIYQKFVQQAKKLAPRFLIMIIPSRWFSGGKGLDEFRASMLEDNRLRVIEDFPDSNDVFPGTQIKGGVCYFLWNRDNRGNVRVTTHDKGETNTPVERPLLEAGTDVFIRYNEALPILKKIIKVEVGSNKSLELPKTKRFMTLVSSRKPFGFDTLFRGKEKAGKTTVLIYQNSGIGYVDRSAVTKNADVIDKWKVFIPRAGSGSDAFPHPILGKPFLGQPGSVSSETYMFIGPFNSEVEARNVLSYISSQLFRLLVLLHKSSQDATQTVYTFVPIQDFSQAWTDEKLRKKYSITEKEWTFVEKMIRPMELGDE